MLKVTELEAFPPNENPFHHDAYHMGTPIGKNIMIMYSQHNHNRYIIVINLVTGERIKVDTE